MKTKKLLLIGAIALVVIGCVIAAGCTSSTTTPQQKVSDDTIPDALTFTTENGVHIIVMKSDGTGFVTTIAKEDGTRILKHYNLTWTKNADGTLTHKLETETTPITLTYDAAKDLFTDTRGNTLTKLDPITGIWFSEGTDLINNKTAKFTDIFKNDGTGVMGIEFNDGTTQVVESTWTKNVDGSYSVSYADGFTDTFVLSQDNRTMNSKVNPAIATMQKKFDDSYYYLSILGPWYKENGKEIFFFNADGTYSVYQNKEKTGEGTWSIPEFGKLSLQIKKGTLTTGEEISGTERIWIYDRVNDTFTSQDGSVVVRPSAAVDSLTYEKFN